MIASRVLVVAALALCCASLCSATIEEANECRLAFLEGTIIASSDEAKCALLQTYNACLNSAFNNVTEEEQQPFWTSFNNYQSTITTPCDIAAAPNVELISNDGGLDFSVGDGQDISFTRLRRDSVSLTDLAASISTVRESLSEAPSRADVQELQQLARTAATEGDVLEMANAAADAHSDAFTATVSPGTRNVMQRIASVEDRLANTATLDNFDQTLAIVNDQISYLRAQADVQLSAQQSTYTASISTIDAQISDLTSTLLATEVSLLADKDDANGTLSDAFVGLNSDLEAVQSELTAEVSSSDSVMEAYTAAKDSIMAEVSTKLSTAQRHSPMRVWSGYCSHHGTNNGWQHYCTDRTDFYSAQGFFSVENAGNGLFRVQTAGLYRINAFAISYSSSWAHILFYHNGVYRHYGHEHSFGTWTDNFLDITWRMDAGDTFYVDYYRTGGAYTFHSGNANGAHSRLQVTYMGEF